MAETVAIDRVAIREMVEDGWRGLIAIDPSDQAAVAEAVRRQQGMLARIAATIPDAQRDDWLRAVVEERQVLIEEQTRDPDGLRRRLGVTPAAPARSGESLGRVAAKTAVRAGIWAAVMAIFFSR